MTRDESRDVPAADQNAPDEGATSKEDGLLQDGAMSLIDHLEELRRTLVSSLVAAAIATAICWFWSQPLLDLLVKPILTASDGVYFHAPLEAFMTRLKISLVCASRVPEVSVGSIPTSRQQRP